MADKESLLSCLEEGVSSSDEDLRKVTRLALESAIQSASPFLMICLKNNHLREFAVTGLAKSKCKAAVPILITLLDDSEIRAGACDALAAIGDKSAISDLIVRLRSSVNDSELAYLLAQVLVLLDAREYVTALTDILCSSKTKLKLKGYYPFFDIAVAVGLLGDDSISDTLVSALKAESAETRAALCHRAWHIGAKKRKKIFFGIVSPS